MNGITLKQELIYEVNNRLPDDYIYAQERRFDATAHNGSLEKAILWGAELAAEIVQVLDDNKVNFSESLGFIDNGYALIPIIKNFEEIPVDWNYLKANDDYLEAILQGVETRLEIASEKARKIVKQAIVVGVETGKLISIIK
jgi:hypothetical protein